MTAFGLCKNLKSLKSYTANRRNFSNIEFSYIISEDTEGYITKEVIVKLNLRNQTSWA